MTRDKVVIAGATGFVGHAVAAQLAARRSESDSEGLEIIGLTRGRRDAHGPWDRLVTCDLFSLLEVERALAGARYVIYLVHSMLPSARLVQGTFADLDLICADNVGRCAAKLGVEQVVYLGGLIPADQELSHHLASRREVELALGGRGASVTALRAGLVIGRNGSTFEMLVRLVRRLPVMVLPSWTEHRCQPIDIATVAGLLEHVLGRRACYGETFDIGGPDTVTYREMLAIVGDLLNKRRPTVGVPLLSPRLSRKWISLVTGAPMTLVAPLVESLRHELICADRRLQASAGLDGMRFRDAARVALARSAPAVDDAKQPRAYQPAPRAPINGVRSVQRIPLPPGRDAEWAAHEYMRWLPRGAWPPLRVEVDRERTCTFYLAGSRWSLLELRFADERSTSDRQLFYITGGLLARPTEHGRLEFRVTPDGAHLLTAIHDYMPAMPWSIYRWSQAIVHHWVMARFGKHLAALVGTGPIKNVTTNANANGKPGGRNVTARRSPHPIRGLAARRPTR